MRNWSLAREKGERWTTGGTEKPAIFGLTFQCSTDWVWLLVWHLNASLTKQIGMSFLSCPFAGVFWLYTPRWTHNAKLWCTGQFSAVLFDLFWSSCEAAGNHYEKASQLFILVFLFTTPRVVWTVSAWFHCFYLRYQESFHGVNLTSLRNAAVSEYFKQPIVVGVIILWNDCLWSKRILDLD